jgi:COMPASS component SWD2
MWDAGSPKCIGNLKISGAANSKEGYPCVAYDQAGLIFAVAINSATILLYDVRKYSRGPFSTFNVAQDAQITKIAFANNGNPI